MTDRFLPGDLILYPDNFEGPAPYFYMVIAEYGIVMGIQNRGLDVLRVGTGKIISGMTYKDAWKYLHSVNAKWFRDGVELHEPYEEDWE